MDVHGFEQNWLTVLIPQ